MASSHSAALAQWRRIEALVQAWLDERQQLIVLLCTLQGLKGLSDHRQPLQKQVQQFCQLLMDYISAGYFEVYRELVNEARHFHRDNPTLTRQILKQLDSSTPSHARTMASQLSEHKFCGLLKLVEHFLCLRKAMKEL